MDKDNHQKPVPLKIHKNTFFYRIYKIGNQIVFVLLFFSLCLVQLVLLLKEMQIQYAVLHTLKRRVKQCGTEVGRQRGSYRERERDFCESCQRMHCTRFLLACPEADWQAGVVGLFPVGCFTCGLAVREGTPIRTDEIMSSGV